MILPTVEQMDHMVPGYLWVPPDYKSELWKYDPSLELSWDRLVVRKHRIKEWIDDSQGIVVSNGLHEKDVPLSSNPVAELVQVLHEVSIIVRIKQNRSATIALADICGSYAVKKIIIIVERGAFLTCIDERKAVTHSILCTSIEVRLQEMARVWYIDRQALPLNVAEIRSLTVYAAAQSSMTLRAAYHGASYMKMFTQGMLQGPEATIDWRFGSMINTTQYHSLITDQLHMAERTSSACVIRAAVRHQAHSMYYGRIIIEPHALKSEACQDHKALLLTPEARASAMPTFQAHVNDVHCAHGSAIGMLDQEQVWYLQSRGIALTRAEELIVQSFMHEVYMND